MVERVSSRQMFEHIVVRREAGRGQHRAKDGVGCVVERIGSDKSPSVNVARQNKLDFRDPLLDSLRLRLRPFVVLFEVVGKVAVQIKSSSIVPKK